jgi:hypothetical protein
LALVLAGALVSPIPFAWRAGLAVAGTLVVLAAERGIGGLRLPQTEKQIPSSVVAQRRPSSAWNFALPYGTGLRTYLPSAGPHVLVVWLVLAAPSLATLAAAAAFGVGRGLPLLVKSLACRRFAYDDSFDTITRWLRPLCPVLVAAVAAAATFAG